MDEIKEKFASEDLSENLQSILEEIKNNPEIQEIYDIYKNEIAD
jgi:hypothetical protein